MDIVKPPITGGGNLASLYGRNAEAGGADQTRTAQGESQTKPNGPDRTAAAPMMQISAEALDKAERQEALQVVKEIYAQLPATRQDVVARVRDRIAEGFYDKPDVKAEVADRLTSALRKG